MFKVVKYIFIVSFEHISQFSLRFILIDFEQVNACWSINQDNLIQQQKIEKYFLDNFSILKK